MFHWLNQYAAAVQALAAVAVVMLTVVLAIVTYRYTSITNKALQLSREQFEKQWKPDLQLVVRPKFPEGSVNMEMVNMAVHSALVTDLDLEFGQGDQVRPGSHRFKHQVPGYGSCEAEIGNLILHSAKTLHKDQVDTEKVDRWETALRISVKYRCAGQHTTSRPVGCRIYISRGKLNGMDCDA